MSSETQSENIIIVGASHAASQVSISLRQGGFVGNITMIGDEEHVPYHHPPLSKEFLSGNKTIEDILIRPQSVYAKANVKLKLSTRVEAIERATKTVLTDNGETLPYDKLILTTGARVRHLKIPGEKLENVFYLRNSEDVLGIKAKISDSKKAVIIGGGYIGLETAASLRKQGLEVIIIEAMPRILQRVTAPELSTFYKRIHIEEGVRIIEGVMASAIHEDGTELKVQTVCGQEFLADFVVIGIGVIPNLELAADAGLTTSNGIEVNEFCQSSDPDIYAAGDVTWHFNPIYGSKLRLESVPNATEQAKTVANHINGVEKPYTALPWFWSDQYDLKLQIAGLSADYNEIIIRGDIDSGRSFSVFYFKGDTFLAVDAVNSPRDFMFGRQVLSKGLQIKKSIVADIEADLKSAVE
ncbi:MAG: pyridine nucleotide-disulfide oxidoreductase [Robiginitomaculum sp.]|nr:MAG: pyridine nucleotide-disulfide oxidoreductase [Robiginitomaculum sp.]